MTSITIPDSVTSIGYWAFYGCSSLTDVYISDIAKWCGISFEHSNSNPLYSNPLYYADNLYLNGELVTELVIPDGVTTIPSYGLSCTSLTSITIPDSVTSIGNSAFNGCWSLTDVYISDIAKWCGISFENSRSNPLCYADNLYLNGALVTELVIPDGVTTIPSYGLSCTSLTSITIPDSITNIGDYAFYGCYKLVEIINKSQLEIVAGSDSYGHVAYYAKEVHNGESKIVNNDDYLFYTYNGVNYLLGYVGTDTAITLPESYNDENYAIYNYAFYGHSGLTSITIPSSVTSIGDYAFSGCCKLVEVINKSELSIRANSSSNGYVAYYAIEVHNGESKIVNKDDYLFYTYDGINYLLEYVGTDTAITLPESYNDENYVIYNYAFYYCDSLTSVTIPTSVIGIGDSAFSGCYRLTSVTIPDSVTSIGNSAFSGCSSLTSVTIPNSVTSIGYGAFKGCSSLTSITIPDGVTSIGNYTFEDCSSLISITIPGSVTSIGSYAFYDCSSLTNVTIGSSVTSIGDWAFYYCSNLTNVYYDGTEADWANIAIASSNDPLTDATIYYYSETDPTEAGHFWYYDENGETAIWNS